MKILRTSTGEDVVAALPGVRRRLSPEASKACLETFLRSWPEANIGFELASNGTSSTPRKGRMKLHSRS